jgi:hypothetical protein
MLSFAQAIKAAKKELHDLTDLDISSVIGAEKSDEDGWLVTIEVIEKRSIPDSMDIMGIYETRLDPEGKMQDFKRVKMRKRNDTEDIEV